MERRDFCRYGFFALAGSTVPVSLGGCLGAGNLITPSPSVKMEEPDVLFSRVKNKPSKITLKGNEERVATTASKTYEVLKDAASNPGKEVRIKYKNEQGQSEMLTLVFTKEVVNYLHPKLVRTNGEVIHLTVGEKSFRPSLKFVGADGKTLVRSGRELEFGFADIASSNQAKKLTTGELIALGVKIAAVGFAIYLGALVAQLLVKAIAFIAFNAFIIGLLIAAGAVIFPLIKKLLEFLGISNFDNVKDFFARGVEAIIQLFREIGQLLPT